LLSLDLRIANGRHELRTSNWTLLVELAYYGLPGCGRNLPDS